jgi:NAD(P)-dependent dehydrogenase (short-subunit alcohol dehydrogenase family)
VNVLAPSLTNSPLASNLLSTEDKQEASKNRHPLGRYGEIGDIAGMTRFLLSDEASWITGQVIGVDGGLAGIRSV